MVLVIRKEKRVRIQHIACPGIGGTGAGFRKAALLASENRESRARLVDADRR